jgi:hypothetical protein
LRLQKRPHDPVDFPYPGKEEMMDNYQLEIRLQMEELICEREGMIAENMQRQHLEQAMAYQEDAFQVLGGRFTQLRELLRK